MLLVLSLLLVLSIVCILICSEFWRLGGDGHPRYRNPMVPLVISVLKFIQLIIIGGYLEFSLLAFLYIPAMWAMLQGISYGLNAPPHKFWVWVFGKGGDGNYKPVEVITRATCGLFWAIPGAIFAFIGGTWLSFILYAIFLTIMNGLIGGLVKDVEISERGVGACVATSILI